MKDLFGNEVPVAFIMANVKKERKSVQAHKLLLQLYGETAGQKCKGCKWLYGKSFSKKYPKCAVSGLDGSTSNTDWSSRWQACGKFETE